jgi:hypothetical protein
VRRVHERQGGDKGKEREESRGTVERDGEKGTGRRGEEEGGRGTIETVF